MNNILIAGVVVVGVSTVLCIVSTAIPYWAEADGIPDLSGNPDFSGLLDDLDIGKTNIGLFQTCYDGKCNSFSGAPGALKATQAMMIIAILALAGSTACAVLFAFIKKSEPLIGTAGAVLAFLGGGFSLLGAIIYAAKKNETAGSGADLHAGFALAIITAVAAVVGGALLFKSRNGQVG